MKIANSLRFVLKLVKTCFQPVSVKRRLQTADCSLQSAFYTDRYKYNRMYQVMEAIKLKFKWKLKFQIIIARSARHNFACLNQQTISG